MPNILDTIQVSGASYDLKDKNAPSVSSLTQSEYDNLPATAKTSNTFFVITDAQAGDLTNYYTKNETNTLLNGKQATLVSGTNIKTINNESILGSGNIDIQGGGGKAVSAGTNISITTGETADTINCTLPISATTQYSDSHNLIFLLGKNTSNTNTIKNNKSYGNIIAGFGNTFGNNYDQAMYNIVFGNHNGLEGFYQGNHADKNFVVGDHNFFGSLSSGYAVTHTAVFGDYNQPKNHYEYVFGKYNVSNTGSTDADKTLFSVGNGTTDNARHNAFEIRQNGDIYCSDGTNDVKLQDTITATAANTTALGGLSLVKLTQAEYDALATKDNSTLYVIVN